MTRANHAAAIARLAGCAIALAGCAGSTKVTATSAEPEAADEDLTHLGRLQLQLQDDILAAYERDEPPDLDSGMIDPKIGTARIGAGPGDVYLAGDLAHAPSRWPLELDRATRTEVRSKHLEIKIAADETAAWMADEVSWRIEMCGRTAVIPLRITALYAHDGDRWVPVFEHLSFGFPPTPDDNTAKPIKTDVISGDLRDELSGVIGRGLFHTPRDPQVLAQDPSAFVLGPDAADEWHGAQVIDAKLPAGRLDERRVGVVGRSLRGASVAYWIGSYVADVPPRPGYAAGKVRMRVTFVFEKRGFAANLGKERACTSDCKWVLVQSHMSQAISDDDLTTRVFGTAMISASPLALDCSDGGRPAAPTPAAAPRRGAKPPAGRSPQIR